MGLGEVGIALGAVAALILIGRFALNPLFHVLAKTGVREVMTAGALMIVLGSAFVMEEAHLSTALGALIAGVMLSESDFRHQLEADIEPFRGLLMGLFFLAVGLSIDLGVLTDQFVLIVAITSLAIIIKLAVTYGVARMMGEDHPAASRRRPMSASSASSVCGVRRGVAGGLMDGPTSERACLRRGAFDGDDAGFDQRSLRTDQGQKGRNDGRRLFVRPGTSLDHRIRPVRPICLPDHAGRW
jgi:glutathione-regulated potassium-efflux system protein KefB